MDNRYKASSWRTISSGLEKWRETAAIYNWTAVIPEETTTSSQIFQAISNGQVAVEAVIFALNDLADAVPGDAANAGERLSRLKMKLESIRTLKDTKQALFANPSEDSAISLMCGLRQASMLHYLIWMGQRCLRRQQQGHSRLGLYTRLPCIAQRRWRNFRRCST